MASDTDIFEKMDALLRKHHPGAPPEASEPATTPRRAAETGMEIPVLTDTIEAPPAGQAHGGAPSPVLAETVAEPPDIPTLSDIIEAPSLEFPAPDDSFPLLTEVVGFAEHPSPVLEPDLDFDEAAYFPSEAEAAGETPDGTASLPEHGMPDIEATAIDAGPPAPAAPGWVLIQPEEPAQEPIPDPATPAAAGLPGAVFDQISDSLSEQVLRNLERQLQQVLEERLAPRLADSLDRALSGMLDQFAVNIQHMIRESVAEELRRQLGEPGP